MAGVKFTNFASTTLASYMSPSDTSLSVAPGTGALFPSPAAGEWFYCVLVDSLTAPTKREIVKVSSRVSDNMIYVARAQEGTTAQTWTVGNYCACRPTNQGLIDLITTTILTLINGVYVTTAALVSFLQVGTGAAVRSVNAKECDFVSVLDFYANGVSGVSVDPTGVVDSTLGIQAALNTLKDVIFPYGTYKISTSLKVAGQSIIGMGGKNRWNQTQINVTGNIACFEQIAGNDQVTFTIKGFFIYYADTAPLSTESATKGLQYGFYFGDSDPLMDVRANQFCTIANCTVKGAWRAYYNIGNAAGGIYQSVLQNIFSWNCYKGFSLHGGTTVKFDTCFAIGGGQSNIGAGHFVIGTVYTISFVGTTDFTLIGAASNNEGIEFTATGVGDVLTTGTARIRYGGVEGFYIDNTLSPTLINCACDGMISDSAGHAINKFYNIKSLTIQGFDAENNGVSGADSSYMQFELTTGVLSGFVGYLNRIACPAGQAAQLLLASNSQMTFTGVQTARDNAGDLTFIKTPASVGGFPMAVGSVTNSNVLALGCNIYRPVDSGTAVATTAHGMYAASGSINMFSQSNVQPTLAGTYTDSFRIYSGFGSISPTLGGTFTVVGGPPVVTGHYSQQGNLVTLFIQIDPNGGTVACVAGVSKVTNIAFTPLYQTTCEVVDQAVVSYGVGVVTTTAFIYPPVFAATANIITIKTSFLIAQ